MDIEKLTERELLLRNGFYSDNSLDMPVIYRQTVDLENVRFLGFQNTGKRNDETKNCTVHFFLEDKDFECVYRNPARYVKRLLFFKQVLTPDFSVYSKMDKWRQIESVAHSRWCGAFWQEAGGLVIPTITWGSSESFDFCFLGVEEGSVVAVSVMQNRKVKDGWLLGFAEMCRRIKPEKVLCYGKPFIEAYQYADIIDIPHEGNQKRKEMRRNNPLQKELLWVDAA
jgi:hypothetical protein